MTAPPLRLIRRMHADLNFVRARARNPNDADCIGCSRGAVLILALAPLFAHKEALGDEIDPGFTQSVEGVERAIAYELLRTGEPRGRHVTRMLQHYLDALPGYLAPALRAGAPVDADAQDLHRRAVASVDSLRAAAPAPSDDPADRAHAMREPLTHDLTALEAAAASATRLSTPGVPVP